MHLLRVPVQVCFCGLLAILLAEGLAVAASDASGRALAQNPEVSAALKVLDAWITATIASREQPGLSIGIVYDQDLIWAKGYGFADLSRKTPATPATLYRIASISKLFTSTAIMQLRDLGKLQLDDPVAKHLTWFKLRQAHQGPVITIRHLITHTSGLPREAGGTNWSDLTFPTRDEMIRRLADQETVFPAETEWKYSNLALSLAGEVVAAVSGEPWHQYIENRILQPLEMTATRAVPKPDTPGLAVGYGRRVVGATRDLEPFVEIDGVRPAGNLASNVEDLAKFVSLQLRDKPQGGHQILKGSTLREMHRIQWLRPDWRSGWGLGFSIRRAGEQVRIGHGGSLPGQRTQIEIVPADKLGVIILTNANDGDPIRYVDQAFTILGPAVKQATAMPKVTAVPDPGWEKYVGTYTWKHADVEVLMLNGKLTMITPEADNPWDSRIVLEPAGSHAFRAVSPGASYGAIGELITFTVSSDGRVTRMSTPNSYWLRKNTTSK
jgi:CubicO group peptidase (beta-lactamase class C family)